MKALSLCAIIFTATLLVACGNKAAAPSTDTPQDMPAAPGNDAKPTAEQGSAPDAPAAAASNDATAAFSKAMSAAVEYQANYDLTAVADGKSVQSSLVQYVKVASASSYKYRMDTSYEGIESRTFALDKTYTTCTQYSGKWTCFTPQSGSEPTTPQAQASEASSVTTDGTMSVAGVTADCYRASTSQGAARYCLYQNIPLYIKTMDKSGTLVSEMKATSYKTTVADSVFTLPAKPSSDPSAAYGGTFPAGQVPDGYDLPNY